MKNIVVGAGVVGLATGTWLKANGEHIVFNDIDADVLKKLKLEGHKVVANIRTEQNVDIYWICTAEWHVDDALKAIPPETESIVVIRSTNPPGATDVLQKQYKITHIAHVPEFLKANTAIDDMFNPDRIIIGTNDDVCKDVLTELFYTHHIPVVCVEPVGSELIKLISNAWLSTQISFWNEIKDVIDAYCVNPQEIANAVTLDKRISKYGSSMLGTPFGGFCLRKDLDSLIARFNSKNKDPILLKAVKEVNKKIGGKN